MARLSCRSHAEGWVCRRSRAVEHGSDFVYDPARNAQILLLDFNQDSQDTAIIGEFHKALRIGDGGDPRLDRDPPMTKQFHDCRCVWLRQVY